MTLDSSIYDLLFKYPGVEIINLPEPEELDLTNTFTISPPYKLEDIKFPLFGESSLLQTTSSLLLTPSVSSSEPAKNPTDRKSALRSFMKTWEGGYANVAGDSGGPTNKGVTIGTWLSVGYDKNGDGKITADDVKLIDDKDMEMVFTKVFWNACKADLIKDPNVANMLVDWMWGSGYAGISRARRALGLSSGNRVDSEMLNVLNSGDTKATFERLKLARIQHFHDIVNRKPSQKKFLKGWLRRVNAINYNSLKGNNNVEYFK